MAARRKGRPWHGGPPFVVRIVGMRCPLLDASIPDMRGIYAAIANGGNETHQKRDGQQETNMSLDNTSHPGGPGRDDLVPSRYALRVGEIDVLVPASGSVFCGSWRRPASRWWPLTCRSR